MNIKLKTANQRGAAYVAILSFLKDERFALDTLNEWQKLSQPQLRDFHLAKEIAFGTIRMALALDHVAQQLSDKGKLSLKLKEKALLRMALYQHLYMDRIPPYAIVDETVKLAKKECHESFVKFLNAVLRKLEGFEIEWPNVETVPEISTKYSYPIFFVQELIQDYGARKAVEILEAENTPSKTLFRVRTKNRTAGEILTGTTSPMAILENPEEFELVSTSTDYYIQNVTPVTLFDRMSQEASDHVRILDLCASPGGKLLLLHDRYEGAELFANDVSPAKLTPLTENREKYGIKAVLTCEPGEAFQAKEPFDLVLLDVPCSNTGVLNKRPEARWRLSQKKIEEIEVLQWQLLKHAVDLIKEDGEIWYMTCSILKRENERIIQRAVEELGLEVRIQETILPNKDGWDGGFACALKRSSHGS